MSFAKNSRERAAFAFARSLLVTSDRLDRDALQGRPALISLAAHAAVAAGIFLLPQTQPAERGRLVRTGVLHETKLIFPARRSPAQENSPAQASGGPTGPSLARSGQPPRPANLLTDRALQPVLTAPPKLVASSSLFDIKPDAALKNVIGSATPLPSAPFAFIGSGALVELSGISGAGSSNVGRPVTSRSGGIFSLSELSQPPVLLFQVQPDYTDEARKAKYQGVVLLRVVIDERGGTRDVRVVRPLGLGLDEKAIEAVLRWRFRPGLRDGQPVPVDANVEINFQLL